MRLKNLAMAGQQVKRPGGYIIVDNRGFVTIGRLHAHRVLQANLITLGFVISQ